jgi:hypothetical protein
VSITDAAGDVAAALLATLLVGASATAAAAADLGEQARNANDALVARTPRWAVRHGQLMRIDLDTSSAKIVELATHSLCGCATGASRRSSWTSTSVRHPFWQVVPGAGVPEAPGDRIVFVTDGMLERNAAEVDVPDALSRSGDLHPREVVHALGDAVMRATGSKLRDDATVVCLDWYGGPPRLRVSTGGASEHYAST